MAHAVTTETTVTIGLDLGDRQTAGCVVAEGGQMLERFEARTPATRLRAAVTRWPGARVVLEVGAPSPWVSRRRQTAGDVVVVANARRVRLIAENDAKSDRLDAELRRQVPGVGPLTALTYGLTLEDPTRFPRSRTFGPQRAPGSTEPTESADGSQGP